jgi:hypothetical protein
MRSSLLGPFWDILLRASDSSRNPARLRIAWLLPLAVGCPKCGSHARDAVAEAWPSLTTIAACKNPVPLHKFLVSLRVSAEGRKRASRAAAAARAGGEAEAALLGRNAFQEGVSSYAWRDVLNRRVHHWRHTSHAFCRTWAILFRSETDPRRVIAMYLLFRDIAQCLREDAVIALFWSRVEHAAKRAAFEAYSRRLDRAEPEAVPLECSADTHLRVPAPIQERLRTCSSAIVAAGRVLATHPAAVHSGVHLGMHGEDTPSAGTFVHEIHAGVTGRSPSARATAIHLTATTWDIMQEDLDADHTDLLRALNFIAPWPASRSLLSAVRAASASAAATE